MSKPNIVQSGIELTADALHLEILRTTALVCDLFQRWTQEALGRMQLAESTCLLRLNEYIPTQRLLTTAEAAAYLGFTKRWLDDNTRPGRSPVVPFLMLGGEKRFRKSSLDRELERREIGKSQIKL